MNPLIIGNWKMNFSLDESLEFCLKLQRDVENTKNIIIAPQAPYISLLKKECGKINFASQNVSSLAGDGSYTGEYNAASVKSAGADYAIIGHYERRKLFSEGDSVVYSKIQNCLDSKVRPIICVGESLEDRTKDRYKETLTESIKNSIPKTDEEIIVAYEPFWSIGTGLVPSRNELEDIFAFLEGIFPKGRTRLIYGGSVDLKNIDKILEIKEITGILLGRLSLNYRNFLELLNLISDL